MPRLFLAAACLTFAGCKRTPAYCGQDLSGLWLNSSNEHFAYQFRDDGGVVTGDFRPRDEDGGLGKADEPITFDLKRSQTALEGVMRTTGKTAGGKICPIEFDTRVNDCKAKTIQVAVEISATVGEDCKRFRLPDGGPPPPVWREYVFERIAK